MRKYWDDFRAFALGGNLVEIAVGLVMALAVAALVQSLIENIVMPLVGSIFGAPDFNELWVVTVNDSAIRFGSFATAALTFLFVAFGVYVFVVKPWTAYKRRVARGEEEVVETPAEEVVLLREIRDALRARS